MDASTIVGGLVGIVGGIIPIVLAVFASNVKRRFRFEYVSSTTSGITSIGRSRGRSIEQAGAAGPGYQGEITDGADHEWTEALTKECDKLKKRITDQEEALREKEAVIQRLKEPTGIAAQWLAPTTLQKWERLVFLGQLLSDARSSDEKDVTVFQKWEKLVFLGQLLSDARLSNKKEVNAESKETQYVYQPDTATKETQFAYRTPTTTVICQTYIEQSTVTIQVGVPAVHIVHQSAQATPPSAEAGVQLPGGFSQQAHIGVQAELSTALDRWERLFFRVRKFSFLRRLNGQIGDLLRQYDGVYQRTAP